MAQAAPNAPLAFDLGMNVDVDVGQSTALLFLARGMRVIAVEAHPRLAARNQEHFANENVTVLNRAIRENAGESLAFCVGGAGARYSVQYLGLTLNNPSAVGRGLIVSSSSSYPAGGARGYI